MHDEFCLVLSTFPENASIETIIETLIQEKLAACVNVLPRVFSAFSWEGKIDKANETLLMIKTSQQRFEALKARLQELHPYTVPEIIALNIASGNKDYLDWLRSTLSTPKSEAP